jgi:hypothetical protein
MTKRRSLCGNSLSSKSSSFSFNEPAVFARNRMGAVTVSRTVIPLGTLCSAWARRSSIRRMTDRSNLKPSSVRLGFLAFAISAANRFSIFIIGRHSPGWGSTLVKICSQIAEALMETGFVPRCRPVFTNHGNRRRLYRWPRDLFRFLLATSGMANPPGRKTGLSDR